MNNGNELNSFFDSLSSLFYDDYLDDLLPNLRELEDVRNRILRIYIEDSPNLQFLDIGGGTGRDAIYLSETFPNANITAIDFCRKMVSYLKKLAEKRAIRLIPVLDDFLNPTSEILDTGDQYDLIITSFTFHHFSSPEKKSAYQKSFNLLKPNGIFLITDLFSFESNALSKSALDFDLEFIEKNLNERRKKVKDLDHKKLLEEYKNHWLEHYKTMNYPDPLEGPSGQIKMLEDIGFKDVSCPFRHWQVGILFGLKR